MDAWSKVNQICSLCQNGRMNAARSIWENLPSDFRNLVMSFVLAICESDKDTVESCPCVEMTSPYGDFTLSPETLRLISSSVMQVI